MTSQREAQSLSLYRKPILSSLIKIKLFVLNLPQLDISPTIKLPLEESEEVSF